MGRIYYINIYFYATTWIIPYLVKLVYTYNIYNIFDKPLESTMEMVVGCGKFFMFRKKWKNQWST